MTHPLFVGTWRLISQGTQYPDGRIEASRGENPQGILMYDEFGNMSVQLMRTDHRAADYTDLSQITTAFEGYHVYFGIYDVDETEKIVRHHIIGAAYMPYCGTVQIRHYEFSGEVNNQLILKAAGSDGTTRILLWERVTGRLSG